MPYFVSKDIRLHTPNDSELGYLAGMIDGDGCLVTGVSGGSEYGIKVSVTDKVITDWLHEHFPGNYRPGKRLPSGKQMWDWSLYRNADLRFLLPLLIPHLVAKRKQAEAMLILAEHHAVKPYFDTPTKSVGTKERTRRRDVQTKWKERKAELTQMVRQAR